MTAPADTDAPVAWRWRIIGASKWIYDPEPEWLAKQSHYEIEKEPLYTALSAQPQGEPVARVKRNSGCGGREFIGESLEFRDLPVGTKLYTAPPSGVREGIALQELQNIVNAKRFDVDKFDDDTDFADWAQSRARHAITRAAEQVNAEGRRIGGKGNVESADSAASSSGLGQPSVVAVPSAPQSEQTHVRVPECRSVVDCPQAREFVVVPRELFEELEWGSVRFDNHGYAESYCLICDQSKGSGHAKACAMLAAATGKESEHGTNEAELRALHDAAWDAILHDEELDAFRQKCSIHEIRQVVRACVAAALAEKDEGGWMPIETAPKDGTPILAADGERIVSGQWKRQVEIESVFVRHAKDGDVYKTVETDNGYWDCEVCPTHWQPLPPLPTERKV